MMQKLSEFLRRRYQDRRLIEADGSNLLQRYGQRAAARALQYELQGLAYLVEGRRKGHWRRVAKCIGRRPSPTRAEMILG